MAAIAHASARPPVVTRRMGAPAPITVLVAEERHGFGEGIAAWLLGEDIAVVGVAPYCIGVTELAAKLRPDVVIVTFGLALRDGLEAMRRTLARLCGARLLVLTPHADHAFGEHIAAAGAAGYLPEEACSELLLSAVRAVHEKHRFFPPDFVHRADRSAATGFDRTGSEKIATNLTPREREILRLVAEGNANKQTAAKLGISIKTVEKHRQSLMDKLRIHDTATLTRYALYAGIVR